MLQLDEMRISDPCSLMHTSRSDCKQCCRSRKYYCATCACPVGDASIVPQVSLPFTLHIIRHPREKASKSSAVPARIVAPKHVQLHDFPHIPPLQKDRTVILFPSPDAISMKDVNWEKTDAVVLIDCTWYQTQEMLHHADLQGMPHVRIDSRKSCFWRYQNKCECHLATVECAYFAALEHFEATKRQSETYGGQYDDLLFYFQLTHKLLKEKFPESADPAAEAKKHAQNRRALANAERRGKKCQQKVLLYGDRECRECRGNNESHTQSPHIEGDEGCGGMNQYPE